MKIRNPRNGRFLSDKILYAVYIPTYTNKVYSVNLDVYSYIEYFRDKTIKKYNKDGKEI